MKLYSLASSCLKFESDLMSSHARCSLVGYITRKLACSIRMQMSEFGFN